MSVEITRNDVAAITGLRDAVRQSGAFVNVRTATVKRMCELFEQFGVIKPAQLLPPEADVVGSVAAPAITHVDPPAETPETVETNPPQRETPPASGVLNPPAPETVVEPELPAQGLAVGEPAVQGEISNVEFADEALDADAIREAADRDRDVSAETDAG